MKKIFKIYSWLLLTTGIILTGIAGIHYFFLSNNKLIEPSAFLSPSSNNITPTASDLESNPSQLVEAVIEQEDGRAELVSKFLERYNSPLKPYEYYGQVFVDIADKYEFDFRLLPAIAQQESNLCKLAPEGTNNCLGFGIHKNGTLGFDTYEEGFERAGRELKKFYIDEGRLTPEAIMKKYTPHSDGSWADSVNQWMAEMRYDDRQKGREDETDANVLEFANPQQ